MDDLLTRYAEFAGREHLLPVRVTAAYNQLLSEEAAVLGQRRGPLHRVVYPTAERLELRAPGEVADFVNDRSNMPSVAEGFIIRKHRDRLLFLATNRCAAHCLYCFRQDLLTDKKYMYEDTFAQKLELLLSYTKNSPEATEVILSGGDPLTLSLEQLRTTFSRLRSETNVREFRIHTRNVVFAPHSLSAAHCGLFADFDVRLVFHVVHPYELHLQARKAINRAVAAGVRCFAQFPILRKINDHPEVIVQLLRELEYLRVRPLTLFIPDPINYSACYRVSLHRLKDIVRTVWTSTPSWLNSMRVALETPIGKVRLEDIVEWDEANGVVVFERNGSSIRYPDLPKEMDEPGELSVLLWRDR